MKESTKELNEIFRKYEVSSPQLAYWLYLTLERITEDYRDSHLEEVGDAEMERMDALADELNAMANNYWYLIK